MTNRQRGGPYDIGPPCRRARSVGRYVPTRSHSDGARRSLPRCGAHETAVAVSVAIPITVVILILPAGRGGVEDRLDLLLVPRTGLDEVLHVIDRYRPQFRGVTLSRGLQLPRRLGVEIRIRAGHCGILAKRHTG